MSSEDASDLTPSVSYSFDSLTMVYCSPSATTQRRLVGYVNMYVETAV